MASVTDKKSMDDHVSLETATRYLNQNVRVRNRESMRKAGSVSAVMVLAHSARGTVSHRYGTHNSVW